MVIKLWMCGNSVLNSKLSRCITEVDLRHTDLRVGSATMVPKFPLMLAHLSGLRHVSITPAVGVISKAMSGYIPPLPETLETLRLTLLDFPLSVFSGLIELSLTQFPSQPHESSSTYIKLPDTLTRISFKEPINIMHTSRFFMRDLPRSLEDLDAQVCVPKFSWEDEIGQDWMTNSPPLLTRIREVTPSTFNKKYLPRTLLNAKLHFENAAPHSSTIDELSKLPPNLQNLELRWNLPKDSHEFVRSGWTKTLPLHLTDLTIDASEWSSGALGLREIKLLPRTLTRLSEDPESAPIINWLHSSGGIGSDTIGITLEPDFWPPNLKELTCSYNLETLPTELLLLPRTLEKLTVYIRDKAVVPLLIDGAALPPKLRELRVDQPGNYRVFAIEIAGKLPESLSCFDNALRIIKSDQAGLYKASFDSFPQGLTRLATTIQLFSSHYGEGALGAKPHAKLPLIPEPWILPSQLNFLEINYWHCLWLEALPRKLQTLIVGSIGGIGQTSNVDAAYDTFLPLPSSLTHIHIDTVSSAREGSSKSINIEYSPKSFAGLPHLKYLHLPETIGRFSTNLLKFVPRNMHVLILRLDALQSRDLPCIPPSLRKIHLYRHMDWKMPGLAQHWPLLEQQSPHLSLPSVSFEAALVQLRSKLYH